MSDCIVLYLFCFFFFNDTATTEIYTLSLHDALPICLQVRSLGGIHETTFMLMSSMNGREVLDMSEEIRDMVETPHPGTKRSEEHTSELQSRQYLVCRLLLEKKKKNRLSMNIQSKPKS